MPAHAVPYGPARQALRSLAIPAGASNGALMTRATASSRFRRPRAENPREYAAVREAGRGISVALGSRT